MAPCMEPEALMEPRPKDKMPPNPIEPLVRAVVFNAVHETRRSAYLDPDVATLLVLKITERLCEHVDQDGWDHSDRVRRASTKLTWGADTDG